MPTKRKPVVNGKPTVTSLTKANTRNVRIRKAVVGVAFYNEAQVAKFVSDLQHAVVFATIPGRQRDRQLDKLLDAATTASCRVLRRLR